jgi:membrane-associated protein
VSYLIDLFLNLDQHLAEAITTLGPWVYVLLFAIVLAETGFVVTPLLPGDSLLFAAGALAAVGLLDITTIIVLLIVAAVLGDAINYSIGRYVGPRVFSAAGSHSWRDRLLNRQHLVRASQFFDRHGGKAVVLGRFVPIIRTFVPFVAGAGAMNYSRFVVYNVGGAFAWVVLCAGAGYVFGNVPVVKDNFSLVALGIVVVSLIPAVVEMLQARRRPADAGGSH